MNREKIREPQRRGVLLPLLLALATPVVLDAQPVSGQESGVLHDRANASRALVTVADQPTEKRPPWQSRAALVALGLLCWHLTQRLLGERRAPAKGQAEQAGRFLGQQDVLLRLSEPLNRFLNDHPRWANALLIVSSALIDGLGIFLFVWSVVGPSIRPFLGLCILFGLRQLCQVLTALPPPSGSIWRNPGFPSLFVTYGVSNDLFFSGHTALAVYGAVELAGLACGWLVVVALAITLFEIAVVLVLRAHYTMDVFAGVMTALYVATIAAWLALPCDRALAHAFAGRSAESSMRSPERPSAQRRVNVRNDGIENRYCCFWTATLRAMRSTSFCKAGRSVGRSRAASVAPPGPCRIT
jgi:PAP2 superfamily C-terminal